MLISRVSMEERQDSGRWSNNKQDDNDMYLVFNPARYEVLLHGGQSGTQP